MSMEVTSTYSGYATGTYDSSIKKNTAAKSNNKIGKKVLAMLCIFVRYNLLVYIILKI